MYLAKPCDKSVVPCFSDFLRCVHSYRLYQDFCSTVRVVVWNSSDFILPYVQQTLLPKEIKCPRNLYHVVVATG